MSTDADMLPLTPQVRETLQQRVYQELRSALARGRFAPGKSLTIRAVAAALGTSPMPVREALRQLVAERALDMLPNRSFGIPLMTRERFGDLARVRQEIEGFATYEAVLRMTPDVIAELKVINKRMLAFADAGERESYIASNQEFHFTIYKASGSQVLIPIIETLWLQVGPYVNYVFEQHQPSVGLDRHEGVIKALQKKDANKAREMILGDISDAAAIIDKHGLFA